MAPVPSSVEGANASCRYSPSGIISIPVGGNQTFTPSNVADCDGAWGFIEPTDGRAEFNFAGTCDDFAQQEGGPSLLKVRRCSAGGVALRIYTNSSKTTLLQLIQIDVEP
jgi:hypothetical protein